MKLCRFNDNRLGLVEQDVIRDVTHVLEALPSWRYPLPVFDPLIANLEKLRPVLEEAARSAPALPLSSVTLLSPVASPGKIVAAPVNYTRHLEEVLADKEIHHGNLIGEIHKVALFLKATSALVGPGEGVRLIHTERRNDHECELAVVIGRTARNVRAGEALDYVAGYCIGLDITIRGPEERSFRKSPDTYAVLGPWLVTADEIPNPAGLELKLSVNGETRQHANTEEFVLAVPKLIEFASSFYTLHPGDIIMTGTPQGVGPINAGDVMVASIARIGSMSVAVTNA